MENEYQLFLEGLTALQSNEAVMSRIQQHAELFGKTIPEVNDDFSATLGKVCTRKIREIHNNKDLIAKSRARIALMNWLAQFIPDKKEIEKIIAAYSIEDTPAQFFRIRDLIDLSKEESNSWIVKGLIPRGAFLLVASQAKCGKSLLATSLSKSFVFGETFLGRATEKGNVLFIQNEENVGKTTVKRILTSGYQDFELSDYEFFQELIDSDQFIVSTNVDIVLDKELLLKKIEELNIGLVIVDSLNASVNRAGMNDKSMELPGYLYEWQHQCHVKNFTLIMIHHTTKMDSGDSQAQMMNGVAGRSDITRANDGIIRLFRLDDKETGVSSVRMHTIPRDGDSVEIEYEIEEGEACRWNFKILEENVMTPENLEIQNKILRLLFERWNQWHDAPEETKGKLPWGMTKNEIVNSTGCEQEAVIHRLNDMFKTDGIMRYPERAIRKWMYSIPPSGETWLQCFLDQEEIIEEKRRELEQQKILEQRKIEVIANDLRDAMNKSDRITLDSILGNIDAETNKRVARLLSKDEMQQLNLVYNPPRFQVGSSVLVIDRNVIGIVDKVAWNERDEYHMYYLQNIEGCTFRQEQICETNRTIDNNSEFSE